MKKTVFVKNAAVLTMSALILRFAGIVFKIWLAANIGADCMGLYQLVFSLYTLAAAGTQSGLPLAVTRLVAENGSGKKAVKTVIKKAFAINSAVSLVTSVILFFGADKLSLIIGDNRAALSVKVMSFSVFFMGVAAIIRGYFIARRKAAPSAVSLLLEQIVRIAVALIAVKLTMGSGIHITCAAVFAGDTAAEIAATAYLALRYRFDIKKLPQEDCRPPRTLLRLIKISLPITAGRYSNNLLRTAENMLVPRALCKFSQKSGLALFGMIKGMALPVLFFPSVLLNAVSTLLVPEMSSAAGHKSLTVRHTVQDVISAAAIGGFIFSAVFAVGGYKIGFLLYKSADVGFLITALAPLVPLMYIDSLADGLLKGLDQQNFTFRVSVSDSAVRLLLIFPVLSHFGVGGFIAIMYLSNIYTSLLNVHQLIKISGASVNTQKTVLIPIFTAFTVTLLAKVLLDFLNLPNLVYIILLSLISIAAYVLLILHFDCINLPIFGRIRTHRRYAAKTITASLIK